MSKPYDASMKFLVETFPRDWLRLVGVADPPEVDLIDSDLATVSAMSDRVIRVLDADPWLMHFELQASRDAELARRILHYNVLLHYRHRLPVISAVVLLRPAADDGELTGRLNIGTPLGLGLEFRYQVIRVWEHGGEEFLRSGLDTYPMIPLSATPKDELPALMAAMADRLPNNADPTLSNQVWAATYILGGLRHSNEWLDQIMKGVLSMEESSTYQAILEKGEKRGEVRGQVREAQQMLLRAAAKKLGNPSVEHVTTIRSIQAVDRLEVLIERVFDVLTWDQLLASP